MALNDKLVAKLKKEGGKKGMDLLGIQETGGTSVFTVSYPDGKGDIEYLKVYLEGANKEIDPEEEERKGGAGELGKAIISNNDNQVAVLLHVPKAVADKVSINAWAAVFTQYATAETTDIDEYTKAIVIKQDSEKGCFVLKIKDEVINNSFGFLRENNLIPPPTDDDDDIGLYTEDIEW